MSRRRQRSLQRRRIAITVVAAATETSGKLSAHVANRRNVTPARTDNISSISSLCRMYIAGITVLCVCCLNRCTAVLFQFPILLLFNGNSPIQARSNNNNEKSARRRRKHCALAVVRRSRKLSPCRGPPSRGRGTAKI